MESGDLRCPVTEELERVLTLGVQCFLPHGRTVRLQEVVSEVALGGRVAAAAVISPLTSRAGRIQGISLLQGGPCHPWK